MPMKLWPDRANDWTNLRLSCSDCNTKYKRAMNGGNSLDRAQYREPLDPCAPAYAPRTHLWAEFSPQSDPYGAVRLLPRTQVAMETIAMTGLHLNRAELLSDRAVKCGRYRSDSDRLKNLRHHEAAEPALRKDPLHQQKKRDLLRRLVYQRGDCQEYVGVLRLLREARAKA